MDDTVLKIALAGLVHDIGKFAERAFAYEQGDKDAVQQDYRYGHAYITEKVLLDLYPEALEQRLLCEGTSEQTTILNLAARHHNPTHPYEWMIAEADRIASGHERMAADSGSDFKTEGRERKSQVPLTSILGRIRLDDGKNDSPASKDMVYRIGLPPLRHDTGFTEGFPIDADTFPASDVRKGYKDHWSRFREEISRIDPEKQFPTFFELCRAYQWCLPASTRKEELPDVSLFEHQKACAALASCLYLYHTQEGQSLEAKAITDRNEPKYRLFCGDISGIQGFIYQISSKGAYKALKGRSFFISLLAEVLAEKVIEAFGLTPANILYSSGGKFYLMLPNIDGAQERIAALSDEINRKLYKKYDGDIYVRTGSVPLCGNDLNGTSGRNLSMIWDELGHRLVFEDRRRYASLARREYGLFFGTGGKGEYTGCEVCHRSMQKQKSAETQRCTPCREMEEIGRKLGINNYLIMAADREALDGDCHFNIFGRYFWFREHRQEIVAHKDCRVWCLNDPEFSAVASDAAGYATVNSAPMIVGGTHRFEKEFKVIAQKAKGVKQLGILRMDVDNLGTIFAHGLRNYQHETIRKPGRFHSLGRITTLSWQLSLFFGAIVPAMIAANEEWHDRVTVVYSGGDDLFILGAWDAIPGVALAIRQAFDRFCCHNPSWGLSGGMVLSGEKFPVYKSAELAGEAEGKAKKFHCRADDGKKLKKNAFTMLDTAMAWQEFAEVSRNHDQLVTVLKAKENRPLLSRLRDISSSWAASRDQLRRASPGLPMAVIKKNIEAEKWRWRMVYAMKRLGEKRSDLTETIRDVQHFITNPVAGGHRPGIELLGVLSRWCEFELRSSMNGKGGE